MSFYKYLCDNGYYFDKYLIENFLLSLKVKPFVILSGKSGTGKMSLSRLFIKFLSDNSPIFIKAPINFSSWHHQEWRLNSNYFEDIFPIGNCAITCNMSVDNIPAIGKITPWIHLTYENNDIKRNIEKLTNYDLEKLENDGSGYEKIKEIFNQEDFESLEIKFDTYSLKNCFSNKYIVPNGSILLKQNSGMTVARDREWTISKRFMDYIPFNSGENPCNISIFNIHSNATIRFAFNLKFDKNKKLQNYLKQNLDKEVTVELKIDDFDFDNYDSYLFKKFYKIIHVNDNLLDILEDSPSILSEDQFTVAYELINEAKNDFDNPYFLIFDDSNLSFIERYLADFLLFIESNESIYILGKHNSLDIPNNLFIVCTVNTNETAGMFSQKVLDKVNTIEFETLSVLDYMEFSSDDDFKGDVDYLQSPLIDSEVSNLNINGLKEELMKISCSSGNLFDVLIKELNMFQLTLKSTQFDFGFGIVNEILRFMLVAWKYENSPDFWDNWERYFDAQIKQKILPKLHGSHKTIGNLLDELFNLCLVDSNDNEQANLFNLSQDNCKYYTSALKLQNMSKLLSNQKYVSFI